MPDVSNTNPSTTESLPLFPEAELPRTEVSHCATCGANIPVNEEIDYDGQIHGSCCVAICECGETSLHGNMVEAYANNGTSVVRLTSRMVCVECQFQCADCENNFQGEPNGCNNSGHWVCDRCGEMYVICYGCNDTIVADDSYSHDDESYCRACYNDIEQREEQDEEEVIIHPYSYKPAARFFRADKQNPKPGLMYCGLEIEFQGDTSVHDAVLYAGIPDSSLWYAKNDGSVDVEIVSHPATWDFWKTASFKWADSLVASGLRSYDAENCGMHVHVSRSALSALDILKLLQFFRKNERYIHRLSRRRRGKMNEYARIDTASDVYTLCKKSKDYAYASNRYEAINLSNHTTVEFRIFRGTASRKGILRNLSFVVAICAFVKDTGLTALGVREFHAWLKHKGHIVLGKEEAKALRQWAISRNHLILDEK